MPAFTTPEPIHVTLDLAAGDVRIVASERDTTVVEVAPRDAGDRADVRAARETRVELEDGRLLVRTPRHGLTWLRSWSVVVSIELPQGSRVEGHTGAGELRAEGALADCAFKSGAGRVVLDRTGALRVTSGAGDVRVARADGDVAVSTGSGAVQLGTIAGGATVKNGSGTTSIGIVHGTARVVASNGDIVVERAAGSLVAKTANGHVRVGAATSGALELKTAHGDVEVGIAQGSAARLDLSTAFGSVDQRLEAAGGPPPGAPTVEVRGRTSYGDIVVRRADPPA